MNNRYQIMTEKFNWESFLDPYIQAVGELKIKLRGARKQYQKQNRHSPIEFVTGRVKPSESIKTSILPVAGSATSAWATSRIMLPSPTPTSTAVTTASAGSRFRVAAGQAPMPSPST